VNVKTTVLWNLTPCSLVNCSLLNTAIYPSRCIWGSSEQRSCRFQLHVLYTYLPVFHSHNPSGRTMALGSTQLLIEMSTRNISWGKDGQCLGLKTLPPSCADCLEILGASTSWNPQGLSRSLQGFIYVYTHSPGLQINMKMAAGDSSKILTLIYRTNFSQQRKGPCTAHNISTGIFNSSLNSFVVLRV
jgi:hypothetical protein